MSSKKISINHQKGMLSWQFKGNMVNVLLNGVEQALFSKEKEIVIALLIPSHKTSKKLVGFSLSGVLRFELDPPEGFVFSYLAEHPEIDIAVVCSSYQKVEGWYDWHFSINTNTGKLERWCPAY